MDKQRDHVPLIFASGQTLTLRRLSRLGTSRLGEQPPNAHCPPTLARIPETQGCKTSRCVSTEEGTTESRSQPCNITDPGPDGPSAWTQVTFVPQRPAKWEGPTSSRALLLGCLTAGHQNGIFADFEKPKDFCSDSRSSEHKEVRKVSAENPGLTNHLTGQKNISIS